MLACACCIVEKTKTVHPLSLSLRPLAAGYEEKSDPTASEGHGETEVMKGHFQREAKFLLICLLGFPLLGLVVGLVVSFFIARRQ